MKVGTDSPIITDNNVGKSFKDHYLNSNPYITEVMNKVK
jgi:hypothetical protein